MTTAATLDLPRDHASVTMPDRLRDHARSVTSEAIKRERGLIENH